MNDKPTKEMVEVDRLLDKIDFLVALIDEDVSNYANSIDRTNTPAIRKKFRKQSDESHDSLIRAAKDFANEH